MRKFVKVCALVTLAVLLLSVPSQAMALSAPSLTVSKYSYTVGGTTQRISFSARVSRPSTVYVTIYSGNSKVNTVRARRVGSRYLATWNIRSAGGTRVPAGLYSYAVRATSRGRTGVARGRLRVYTALTLSATARSETAPDGTTSGVYFDSKPSPNAVISVSVWEGDQRLRSISTTQAVSRTSVPWDLRDSAGQEVAEGDYVYRVTAKTTTQAITKKGTVRVRKTPLPAPAPEPTVTPVPAPAPAPAGRWVGFYIPGVPANGMAGLSDLEGQINTHASVVNFFISDSESFPTSRAQSIADHGSTPLVTLEFWSTQNGGLATITNGSRDAYLRNFAASAKSFGGEVWVRPLHEMNGDWYPWGGAVNGNTSASLVAAWRHIHDVFEAEGATNIKLVWSVNNDSVPNTTANQIEKYWPGDAYVDYVALDGYNWGTTATWSSWKSFGGVFGPSYTKVTGLTQKPLFIAETATVETGGSKAAWISDMFSSIETKYTRVKGVVWFNANKERDWRIESSATSLGAYRTAASAGY